MLWFGGVSFRAQRKLARTGLKARGTIVLVESNDKPGESEMTVYTPTFEFQNADGVVHRVREGSTTPRKGTYRVGKIVEVVYRPGEEEQAAIHSFAAFWGFTLAMLVAGVVLLVGGYMMMTGGDHPNEDTMVRPGVVHPVVQRL